MVHLAHRIASSSWFVVVPVTAGVLLFYGVAAYHQQLSRHEVINAVLTKEDQGTHRYALKLVRESDLEKAAPEWGHVDGPDFYVWVVAVSGDFGIRGEYQTRPNTWGVALVKDQRPAILSGTIGDASGRDWPPLFDQLVDLRN